MRRIGFFEMLASDFERDAINSAQDTANAALDGFAMQAETIRRLTKRLHDQDRQIQMLSAAVGVLAAVLRDNGLVDPEILDARLEAAIENTQDEVAKAPSTVACQRCAKQVAIQRTVMTASGTICDACHARWG